MKDNSEMTYSEILDNTMTPRAQEAIQAIMDNMDKHMDKLSIGERTAAANYLSSLMMGTTLGQLLKNHRYMLDEAVEAHCEDITDAAKQMFEVVDTHIIA
ncbi:MAG: hypothetical protein KGV50_05895 [Gammaproteobacteria bacterium]|nr:hypothetical protein [Gammaproteobacteria bacterium]